MRLLKTYQKSANNQVILQLQEFTGVGIPRYAILSHTWERDEVLFADIVQNKAYAGKHGLTKVIGALNQAYGDGFEYLWIDTCCIDKSSSAELSEAINSMWTWYQKAGICYALLQDVFLDNGQDGFEDAFAKSRWWSRGWTLQELLAPSEVKFFNHAWTGIGTRSDHVGLIYSISRIDADFLLGTSSLQSASIAKRMSWMGVRETTREEDIAYCLLGLFSVNMPLLYGEGSRAFLRLQTEIMSSSDDHSLFAWIDDTTRNIDNHHGLLADSPSWFMMTGSVFPYTDWGGMKPYSMTNRGLNIELPLSPSTLGGNVFEAALHCQPVGRQEGFLTIHLRKVSIGRDQYVRTARHLVGSLDHPGKRVELYVKQNQSFAPSTVYPHHFFVLRSTGNSNVFSYYMITGTIPYEPPQGYYPKPVSREKALPTVYRINKQAGRLTTAVVLRNRNSETTTRPDVVLMLGSITDFEIGFDFCELGPAAPDRNQAQGAFESQPMGTVFEIGP